jgi:hypothetical protein
VEVIYQKKRGKPVDGYRFHFADNMIEGQMSLSDWKDVETDESNKERLNNLKDKIKGLTDKDVKKLINTANSYNKSTRELLEIMEYVSQKNVKNYVGYVVKLIKDGLDKPIEVKNGFNNMMTSDYDIEELEKMLISKQTSST